MQQIQQLQIHKNFRPAQNFKQLPPFRTSSSSSRLRRGKKEPYGWMRSRNSHLNGDPEFWTPAHSSWDLKCSRGRGKKASHHQTRRGPEIHILMEIPSFGIPPAILETSSFPGRIYQNLYQIYSLFLFFFSFWFRYLKESNFTNLKIRKFFFI